MAKKKKRAATRAIHLGAGQGTTTTVNYSTEALRQKPATSSFDSCVKLSREWADESLYVKTWLDLSRALLNYGFTIRPAADGGDQKAIDDWLKQDAPAIVDEYTEKGETVGLESNKTVGEVVDKFAEDIWTDWILLRNVVAMWVDNRDMAWSMDIRTLDYTDTMGVEIVRWQHGLGKDQIERLPDEERTRFGRGSTIILDVNQGEHFKVLKRATFGNGFGTPPLYSIFRLLAEIESKERGQHGLAWGTRSIKRVHKLGHEIKQGMNAGKPLYHWNKKRSAEVLKFWADKDGFEDFTTNFDYELVWPYPDPKLFDEAIWKGSDRRFYRWAGPVGEMIVSQGVRPYLPNMLKAWAVDERRKVGAFLESVINRAFKPPGEGIKVTFSNMIFTEARLQSELLKFAQQNGWLSAQTGQEEVGLNPEEEAQRKMEEANDAEAKKKFLPMWDPSHGISPATGETTASIAAKGQDANSQTGRKPGTPDPS